MKLSSRTQAYEHAFAAASLFAKSKVIFLALDELAFVKPVEIGKLLSLDARVTFAPIQEGHRSFCVSVEASTVNLHTGERQLTNQFNFTFQAATALDRYVVPRTFLETLSWTAALRRRTQAVQFRKDLVASGNARAR